MLLRVFYLFIELLKVKENELLTVKENVLYMPFNAI